jgi:hypothetical protein
LFGESNILVVTFSPTHFTLKRIFTMNRYATLIAASLAVGTAIPATAETPSEPMTFTLSNGQKCFVAASKTTSSKTTYCADNKGVYQPVGEAVLGHSIYGDLPTNVVRQGDAFRVLPLVTPDGPR